MREIIKLSNRNSYLTINLLGSLIEDLVIKEVPLLGQVKRGDGKVVSSHPCAPIFGPETITKYGLPQHGSMRNNLATLVEQTENQLELQYEINNPNYPPGILVKQNFKIEEDKIFLTTTFINQGQQDAPINFAQHFYWLTPLGWQSLQINNKRMEDLVKQDQGFFWLEENIVSIEGRPNITLTQSGLPYCQLWAYRENNNFDTNYVCIEPAMGPPRRNFFGSSKSLLKAGETKELKISISINK
jgi:galactose mutarotase-like enzyme